MQLHPFTLILFSCVQIRLASDEKFAHSTCVSTFWKDIAKIGPLCGAPATSASGDEGNEHSLFKKQLRECESASYKYDAVSVDIWRYFERVRSQKLDDVASWAMQEIEKQIHRQMLAEEKEQLVSGFGICVPKSCQSDAVGFAKVVILYLGASLGIGEHARASVAPHWCSEIRFQSRLGAEDTFCRNDTSLVDQFVNVPTTTTHVPFRLEVRSASKTPTLRRRGTSVARMVRNPIGLNIAENFACFKTFTSKFTDTGYNSGAPYMEVDGSLLPYFVTQYQECTRSGHLYALVHLDPLGYLYGVDWPGEKFGTWLEKFVVGFFTDKLYEGEVDHLRTGFGVCLPRSCENDIEGVGRSMAFYFGRLSGVSDEDSTYVPSPLYSTHFNVTFDYPLARILWSPGPPLIKEDIVPPELPAISVETMEAIVEHEDARATAMHRNFLEPWLTCSGEAFAIDWSRWRRRFRASLRTFDSQMDRDTAELADMIVQHSHAQMLAWTRKLYWANGFTRSSGRWPHVQDLVRVGLTKDGRGSSDELVGFCPLGAFTALVARAWSFLQASKEGYDARAVKDFEMARMLLGPQREFDMLDAKTWGITSLDMDVGDLLKHKDQVDGRPYWAKSEAPKRGERRLYKSFSHVFPLKGSQIQAHVWNALRLNTLIRQELTLMAIACPAAAATSVTVMAWPPTYALFVLPYLARVRSLRLGLISIGPMDSIVCDDCFDLRPFIQDVPEFNELPYTMTVGGGLIDWEKIDEHNFTVLLWKVFSHHPWAAGSQVVVCSAPTWLCIALRSVMYIPMLVLDMAASNIGAPPRIIDGQMSLVIESSTDVYGTISRPLMRGKQTIVVREDLGRSYSTLLAKSSTYAPFVSLLSLYIQARHLPHQQKQILIMREGALRRFSITARGSFFYSCLREANKMGLWNFRFLSNPEGGSTRTLTYQELADHRAIIFVPFVHWGKLTPKDLLVLEVPLFHPSRRLLISMLGHEDNPGESENAHCSTQHTWSPWTFVLCRFLLEASYSAMSGFFRYPHMMHFGGIADLLQQVLHLDQNKLLDIHEKMKGFNQILIEDDVKFWKDAVRGLACGRRVGQTPSAPWYRSIPRDPDCIFGIKGPGRICCPAWCGDCTEENCELEHLKDFKSLCCPKVVTDIARDCAVSSAPCILPIDDLFPSNDRMEVCMDRATHCKPEVLRFGTHLDQVLPEELASIPEPE